MGNKILVTGGAGFIGSHLTSSLVKDGHNVVVVDDLSSGSMANLEEVLADVEFITCDILNKEAIRSVVKDVDVVFHLAAAPEVKESYIIPEKFWKVNVEGTRSLLEAIREGSSSPIFIFFSSSTVYGEALEVPTKETYGPLRPISVYGASKLAAEAMTSAYAYSYGFKAVSVRLGNIVGRRSRHGILFDFVNKLRANPKKLEILGNGRQSKSYLHVSDCVSSVKLIWRSLSEPYDVYNIGSEDRISVDEIAMVVTEEMGLEGVELVHIPSGPDGAGWVGDVKIMQLDITKLKKLGWTPVKNSKESIRLAVRELLSETGWSSK